jgi:glutaredoxin
VQKEVHADCREEAAAHSSGRRHIITVYSKPDCHLCERAKEALRRVGQQTEFFLEEVNISQNPELLARYGHDIPVILLDGREIARHFVRERKLLKLLQ